MPPAFARTRRRPQAVEAALGDLPDERVPALLSDLGGHDLAELLHTFNLAAEETGRPTVVFAYTIKGWGLPIAGHPANHSALLSAEQIEQLRIKLEVPAEDHWAKFPAGSPEDQICRAAAERLREPPEQQPAPALRPEQIPASIDHEPLAITSTQETLGRLLFELVERPEIGKRIVTVAPDVAVSTNLGGWINKVGVYSAVPVEDHEPTQQAVHWRPSPQGQHMELGISEMNLFLLLGQLGLSQELLGQTLLPIGTVYDPFVLRGLDAFIYALYNHARFIVVGTPSGVSLSPEGGAHQSTVTPGLGIGLPNLNSYEPTFAREVEWILLDALRGCLDREHGRATYLRLSTKPIEQTLFDQVLKRLGEEELRRQVLSGGYRLIDHRFDAPNVAALADPSAVVQIAAVGAMIPEAVTAARWLHEEGVAANVLAITSADRLYAALVASRRAATSESAESVGGESEASRGGESGGAWVTLITTLFQKGSEIRKRRSLRANAVRVACSAASLVGTRGRLKGRIPADLRSLHTCLLLIGFPVVLVYAHAIRAADPNLGNVRLPTILVFLAKTTRAALRSKTLFLLARRFGLLFHCNAARMVPRLRPKCRATSDTLPIRENRSRMLARSATVTCPFPFVFEFSPLAVMFQTRRRKACHEMQHDSKKFTYTHTKEKN